MTERVCVRMYIFDWVNDIRKKFMTGFIIAKSKGKMEIKGDTDILEYSES